jgi:hypothetical protein
MGALKTFVFLFFEGFNLSLIIKIDDPLFWPLKYLQFPTYQVNYPPQSEKLNVTNSINHYRWPIKNSYLALFGGHSILGKYTN